MTDTRELISLAAPITDVPTMPEVVVGGVESPVSQARPARRWRRWALGVAVVALLGTVVGYALVQRSHATDWRETARRTEQQRVAADDARLAAEQKLATAQASLTSLEAQVTAATARYDAVTTQLAATTADRDTAKADLTRVTSLRDQLRSQLVAGHSLVAALQVCVEAHDAVIDGVGLLLTDQITESQLQQVYTDHMQVCDAAYGMAAQWDQAVAALGI